MGQGALFELAVLFHDLAQGRGKGLLQTPDGRGGGAFGFQLGGALVVETVFSIPGLGKYMMDAINQRDYPSIRGTVIFLAIAFSIVMLAVDIMYAFIDPRIKGQYQSKKRGK